MYTVPVNYHITVNLIQLRSEIKEREIPFGVRHDWNTARVESLSRSPFL